MLITCGAQKETEAQRVYPSHTTRSWSAVHNRLGSEPGSVNTTEIDHELKMQAVELAGQPQQLQVTKPLLGARHTTQSPNFLILIPRKNLLGISFFLQMWKGGVDQRRPVFPREAQQECGWVHFTNLGLPDLHLSVTVLGPSLRVRCCA